MADLSRAGLGLIVPTRTRVAFRAVNRRGEPGYDPGLQRHHILPRQILRRPCFTAMLDAMGRERLGFDDFRRNGLLLPANDFAAVRIGLPLHCGPHHAYNQLVIERIGQIEGDWVRRRLFVPELALCEAFERLQLLQRALRRRLLDQQRRMRLNRRDPLGRGVDFAELDAMAAMLWPATDPEAGHVDGGAARLAG